MSGTGRRLKRLKMLPIHGNAHDDRERLLLATAIILDESLTANTRFEAIKELDATMGEPTNLGGLSIEAFVAKVAKELRM